MSIMGELPDDLGIDSQEQPFGDQVGNLFGNQQSVQRVGGTPSGAPARNVYTTSVFDARPPLGRDFNIDTAYQFGEDAQTFTWITLAEYGVNGGKVGILRGLSCDILSSGLIANKNSLWRVLIDGNIVEGLNGMILSPLSTLNTVKMFTLCGSNKKITIQRYCDDTWNGGVNYATILIRMYIQELVTQNVTLPWEPCNVE